MATRRYFLIKKRKKENENCRCLDETQILRQKAGRVYFWQQEALLLWQESMEEILAQSGEFTRRQWSLSIFSFFIFHFHLLKKSKREERCEVRFTSAGKLLQELKSQHILKKSSLIDKLSIVFLPQSDNIRNFSFSNFAAVVFASFINSQLIINQVFPFVRRCSSVSKSFRNWQAPISCQGYMQALFSFLQISRRSFG